MSKSRDLDILHAIAWEWLANNPNMRMFKSINKWVKQHEKEIAREYAPYPFCYHPEKCDGKCSRDPICCD